MKFNYVEPKTPEQIAEYQKQKQEDRAREIAEQDREMTRDDQPATDVGAE